eukprot:scaffold114195_cov31-Prasinocladus_malaysianus.AAC.2
MSAGLGGGSRWHVWTSKTGAWVWVDYKLAVWEFRPSKVGYLPTALPSASLCTYTLRSLKD